MRSGVDSRLGSLNMRSEFKFHGLVHLPANPRQEYFTSRIHHNYRPIPSWCMDFYTSLMALRLQDRCGQPGGLSWNDTVATSNEVQYGVGSTHW